MEFLRWLNGEFAQGVYFAEPLDASAAERFLAAGVRTERAARPGF
jgi:EAL domain-containing protein (putative c-di-GMP-specific phosphodiesterase class I)